MILHDGVLIFAGKYKSHIEEKKLFQKNELVRFFFAKGQISYSLLCSSTVHLVVERYPRATRQWVSNADRYS